MGLDIRLPIGLMFSLLGALLAAYGFATRTDAALYARSLGLDVDLAWGLVLLAFGLPMLAFALKDRFKK